MYLPSGPLLIFKTPLLISAGRSGKYVGRAGMRSNLLGRK